MFYKSIRWLKWHSMVSCSMFPKYWYFTFYFMAYCDLQTFQGSLYEIHEHLMTTHCPEEPVLPPIPPFWGLIPHFLLSVRWCRQALCDSRVLRIRPCPEPRADVALMFAEGTALKRQRAPGISRACSGNCVAG